MSFIYRKNVKFIVLYILFYLITIDVIKSNQDLIMANVEITKEFITYSSYNDNYTIYFFI